MIKAHEYVRVGAAALTDLALDDVEAIVRYWHESGDAHLNFLGIDRSLLGEPCDTRARYVRALRTGDSDQRSIAFAIRFDETLVGYTLLNRYAPDTNYSHWHITAPALRACGISSALYPYRVKMYFDLYPIARLIHQTRTRNTGVNRMLDKYVAVAETCHVQVPDGVADSGEFHIRYVHRTDIPELFRRAVELSLCALRMHREFPSA